MVLTDEIGIFLISEATLIDAFGLPLGRDFVEFVDSVNVDFGSRD